MSEEQTPFDPAPILVRREDWPQRLGKLIHERASEPFEWGRQDCCLFAADCVEAMTGVDLAGPLRGYSTALGAASRARLAGAASDDLFGVHLWAARAGLRELRPLQAQRGDVVLIDTARREVHGMCLGVCVGAHAAAPGADGLAFYESTHWVRAWAVGART